MKRSLALCLFASTFTLTAALAAKTPAAEGKPTVKAARDKAPSKGKKALRKKAKAPSLSGAVQEGPLLPITPPAMPPLPDLKPAKGPSFWLAANPHVPLAKVDGKVIHSVGQRGKDCGAMSRWAKPGSRWKAIDAWGQVAGSFAIAGSELYDVTGCREVSFQARSRKEKEGVGLFVSEDSTWRPSPSVAWKPSASELKSFERFASALEEVWVNERPHGKIVPLAKRSMFFSLPTPDPIFAKRPKHWAVLGGPILVVAYLGQNGHWKVAEVKKPLGLTDSYKPLAIFDLNKDGVPEIVYSSNDGPSFSDSVLSLDPDTLGWNEKAESPGGATL